MHRDEICRTSKQDDDKKICNEKCLVFNNLFWMAAGEVQVCRGSGTLQTLIRPRCNGVCKITWVEHHEKIYRNEGQSLRNHTTAKLCDSGYGHVCAAAEPFENQFLILYTKALRSTNNAKSCGLTTAWKIEYVQRRDCVVCMWGMRWWLFCSQLFIHRPSLGA